MQKYSYKAIRTIYIEIIKNKLACGYYCDGEHIFSEEGSVVWLLDYKEEKWHFYGIK